MNVNDRLLIVGIDPGTTVGYAVLDTTGSLLISGSSKELDLDSLIQTISPVGKVLFIGTDKAKIPSLVGSFAAKFKAKVHSPREDLRKDDKREMTRSYSFKTDHEQDAIASALFALKQSEPLLLRISKYCEKENKQIMQARITELVVKQQLSIRAASALLEEPTSPIVEEITEERPLEQKDFARLYNQVVELRKEKDILKQSNKRLVKALKKSKAKPAPIVVQSPDKRLSEKDRRIFQLIAELNSKKQTIVVQEQKLDELYQLLARLQDIFILKRFKNLGTREVQEKKDVLKVRPGDILLVDDADEHSEQGIAMLKDKIGTIVAKKASRGTIARLPFIVLNAGSMKLRENQHFGFIGKKEFEREKNSKEVLKKIVEDYRKERSM